MSLHDAEDLHVDRRIDVTYETVRCSANKFGPVIDANLRRRRGRAGDVWHFDENVPRGSRIYEGDEQHERRE